MKNILFCGNDKVFDGALTTILSILKRTESTEPFNFIIFTMDVSELNPNFTPMTDSQILFLDKLTKEYNSNNSVKKIDVTDLYKKEFSGCPNEGCYCSPYTLIRLFADIVLPEYDKLLYLDIDLLFNKDISLLYDIDVEGYEYAAARDHYGKFLVNPNFVNAGVLLFNMKECKKTKLFDKSRNWIKTKKLIFADESAIIRSTTKKKMISQRFNDQKFLYKNTVIRHFSKRLFWLPYPHTANIKQWKITQIHKIFGYENFDDILYEYVYQKSFFERNFSSTPLEQV
ncbi:MAG: lipopolysaccharide biosynthesis protein [Treponema sp.]|nr:lipopolysaccharide biosynthesis protein [Treponema sp.]